MYSIPSCILLILWLSFAVAGCGGSGGGSSDGGGGSAPMSYSGLTSQAAINATNAEDLTTGALLGSTVGISVLASGEADKNVAPTTDHLYIIDLPAVLERSTEDVDWRPGGRISIASAESDSINGGCGGSFSYAISVDDATGNFSGTFDYAQFCEGGVTITGAVGVDGSIDLATNEFKVINFGIDNLRSDDFAISGNISINATDPTSSSATLDFLFEDIVSNKVYWVRDYSINVTEINATDTEKTVAGVFYNPDYGYVNVSTPVPLTFLSGDERPSSGTMLFEGAGNTKAILTAVDNQSYSIEADSNGDGLYDYVSGVLFWAN